MSDRKRHGFVLLLVAGLLAASIVALLTAKTELGLDLRGGVQLIYQGEPSPQTPKVTQTALNRAVEIMQSRVDQLGVSQPSIEVTGNNQIEVSLPAVHDVKRAENTVGTTSQLYFYDWEANLLTPSGKTVASQLVSQNPQALLLSQGGGGGPGIPGAGGVSLYQAAKLAARQPATQTTPTTRKFLSRLGSEYLLFGAPGSQACKAVATQNKTTPVQGDHCFIAGGQGISTRAELAASVSTPGVTLSNNEVVVIPQGTLVLQAGKASSNQPTQVFGAPNTQYYVLKDHVALRGNEITNPQASSDPNGGGPDVTFGFNSRGARAFQNTTKAIAHRGAQAGLGRNPNFQHFATALDNQLLTVPQIDYKQFPDGIVNSGGSAGASITGGFTTQSAQDLATQLRLGALPVTLKQISENQVSATLGSQALHDGLLAGGIGLIVVVLFLIAYYRVLGLIATSTLLIYAVYFYALIKIIPITLTLAGIAGLILTIGVAADANIVIFERVKEEIRAGRSIRTGIITGYRKGLSAIIDANVVTIITAFILFVLATQSVQGFAFTLGIGTIVSLFTAVLATQAILMTAGDSRTLARPSALGAGKPRRRITFNFMGASRYFFTLSGVILLVGALAIGGRGLKLGIDFTSGSKVTTTLSQPVSNTQVSQAVTGAGASSPTVQRVGGSGSRTFEISFKNGSATKVRDALQTRYGGHDASVNSIGPSFGNAVTHSAIVAIIASLLVISAYVALRFEWKFAIPVLIALAHDILITAGVYALTGKQVTVDTVAALLTILGYSLYDTIIVFDRVRENVPRMPRAAFSQIVNRSMSEVITRSLATTTCTLLPILALVFFGGAQLNDFAFALLIGVASGAYSSIFIASPVLTHWKEREPTYRHRRARIEADNDGVVPAYATTSSDVEPRERRARRRARLTTPEGEGVDAAEFEQLSREIAEDQAQYGHHTSTLARRMAHTEEDDLGADADAPTDRSPSNGDGRASDDRGAGPGPGTRSGSGRGQGSGTPSRPRRTLGSVRAEQRRRAAESEPGSESASGSESPPSGEGASAGPAGSSSSPPAGPDEPPADRPRAEDDPGQDRSGGTGGSGGSKSRRSRNRRHGRR